MRVTITTSENLSINYEVAGEGPDVVLVHGLGLSSMKTWTFQVPELAKHFRIHTYDVRGFGESDNPSGKFSVQQHAYDLHELLKSLQLENVILVGFSMGGWISLQFILDHPENVCGLVLSCTTSGLRPDGARRFVERADRVEQLGMGAVVDEQIRNTFDAGTREKRPDLISFYRKNFLDSKENNPKSYATMFRALSVPNVTPQLSRITCPTLIMCGGADQGITRGNTPTDASEILHEGIRNSKVVVIPNGGHYVHLEKPEEWNKEVIQFVRSI